MFKKFYSNKLICLSQLICISLLTITFFNNPVLAEDLNSIQRQIELNKQNKLQKQKQQKQLEQELAKSDQEIAKSSLQVSQTKNRIAQQRSSLLALQKKTDQLKEEKKKQQSLLEQQLTSAYMAGQNDLIKLIVNQEDLSKVVRAKSYYHYLNEARLDSIEKLQNTQLALEKNQAEEAKTLASLREMYEQQKKTEATVRSEKAKRDKALKALNKDIDYQDSKLAELSTLEKNLRARIQKASEERARAIAKEKAAAEARRKAAQAKAQKEKENEKARALAQQKEQQRINSQIAKQTSNAKFSTLKKKLKWPIRGKVLNRFGTTRSSQVKWKGITLSASEGEQVRAVAAGRVLYAGYFKGYGMVIAIDHGDNYITLYGYNQTLLQQAGAIIAQGEAIALAGKSGGQETSSLYFELNHKGKAQNPLNWLSKKPW